MTQIESSQDVLRTPFHFKGMPPTHANFCGVVSGNTVHDCLTVAELFNSSFHSSLMCCDIELLPTSRQHTFAVLPDSHRITDLWLDVFPDDLLTRIPSQKSPAPPSWLNKIWGEEFIPWLQNGTSILVNPPEGSSYIERENKCTTIQPFKLSLKINQHMRVAKAEKNPAQFLLSHLSEEDTLQFLLTHLSEFEVNQLRSLVRSLIEENKASILDAIFSDTDLLAADFLSLAHLIIEAFPNEALEMNCQADLKPTLAPFTKLLKKIFQDPRLEARELFDLLTMMLRQGKREQITYILKSNWIDPSLLAEISEVALEENNPHLVVLILNSGALDRAIESSKLFQLGNLAITNKFLGIASHLLSNEVLTATHLQSYFNLLLTDAVQQSLSRKSIKKTFVEDLKSNSMSPIQLLKKILLDPRLRARELFDLLTIKLREKWIHLFILCVEKNWIKLSLQEEIAELGLSENRADLTVFILGRGSLHESPKLLQLGHHAIESGMLYLAKPFLNNKVLTKEDLQRYSDLALTHNQTDIFNHISRDRRMLN